MSTGRHGVGVGVTEPPAEAEGEAEAVAVAVAVGVGEGGTAVAVEVGVAVGLANGVAGAGTKTELLVPVMESLLVSVAVIAWFPGVLRVTTKKPVPLVKVLSGGRFAPLVLVKCTVPV